MSVQALSSCGRRSSAFAPFRSTRKPCVTTRVAEGSQEPAVNPLVGAPLTWEVDNETAREVFAFAGPAPERANGRAAMIGFTSVALAEMGSHVPALQQIVGSIPGVIIVSLALTVATIVPKIVAGVSLKDLHATATSENLKTEGLLGQALAAFDTNIELWSGRLAMIGLLGLVVTETIKGDALF